MSAVCIIYRLGFLRLSAHRGSQDCGTTIANGGAPTPPSNCSMVCSGNSSEFCGGPNRLNVYNYTGTDLPSRDRGGDDGSPVFPVISNLQMGWSYNACWV